MLRLFHALWPREEPYAKARLWLAIAMVVLSKLIQVFAIPLSLKAAVDGMAHSVAPPPATILLLVGFVVGRLSATLFMQLRGIVFERVAQAATGRLSTKVFARLHSLPISYHLEANAGALSRIIERGTGSVDALLHMIMFSVFPTAIELFMVALLLSRHFGALVTISTLIMVCVYVILTRAQTERRGYLQRTMNAEGYAMVSQAVESLMNIEAVRYLGGEEREVSTYRESRLSYAASATRSENFSSWTVIWQALLANLTLGFGMVAVASGWGSAKFTPGEVVLVSTLLTQLFQPLDALSLVYRSLRIGGADMAEMIGILDQSPEDEAEAREMAAIGLSGAVKFENVSFAYEPSRSILKNLSISVPAGKTIAIVGKTGSGKSTILRLLYRLYDVADGAVTIGGRDVRFMSRVALRRAVGIVSQETVLFNNTILYNIAYARPEVSRDEVESAAKAAQIHDLITSLPEGYETRVGYRGLKLSGGERQRIGIARVLIKRPRIFALDEATSALDSKTEVEIRKTLEVVLRGRTTIIVTHRLSSVVHADEVIVLDGGEVRERGTHEELLDAGSLYAEMWRRQSAGLT